MPELNASIEIAAPVEAVFDYVDDYRNTPGFMRAISTWEPVDPAKVQGEGARFKVGFKAGPVNVGMVVEFYDHDRPRRIAYRSVKGYRFSGEWVFSPTASGTLVELKNTFELPGGIAGRLLKGFVENQARKELEASLAELRRRVESR